MATTNSTQRSNEKLHLVDDYGVKYSADGKKLISVPKGLPYYEVLNGTDIIGREAFKESDVEMVLLPCTITTIEYGGFLGCKALHTIKLPFSIKEICSLCFCGCESLRELWLPNIDVVNIRTFQDCRSLERVFIPSGVEVIDVAAFSGCTSLRSVLVPIMARVEAYAFSECQSLSDISLPLINDYLGENALERCESLTSVDYWYKYIPSRTFSGCKSLEVIRIKGHLEMVEDDAFYFCDNLRQVEFCTTPHPAMNHWANFFRFNDAQQIEFLIPTGTEEDFTKLYEYAKDNPKVKITVKDNLKQPEVEQEDISDA